MEFIVGSIAGLILTIVVLALLYSAGSISSRLWVALSAGSAPFQIHTLGVAGFYPSLSLLSGLAAFGSMRYIRFARQVPWLRPLCLLLLVQLISMAWSSQPIQAVRYFIYELPLLFVFLGAFALAIQYPERALAMARRVFFVACLTSPFVILFRFVPAIEGRYLGSGLATLLISPNILLSDISTFNVNDPAKAGGLFFVNSNVAAAFYGFCAIVAWHLGQLGRSSVIKAGAVLSWLAAMSAGSKAGLLAALLIPSLLFAMNQFKYGRAISVRTLITWCVTLAVVVVVGAIIYERIEVGGFARASSDTFAARELMWTFAASSFKAHPLLGLGFGGWEDRFCSVAYFSGLRSCLPPHNAIVMLWSQSGLVAGFCGAAFAFLVLRSSFNSAMRASGRIADLGFAVFGGCLWIFFQAMGENFGFFGEPHITPLLGLLLGVFAGLSVKTDQT